MAQKTNVKDRGRSGPWTVIIHRGITRGRLPRAAIERVLTRVGHGERRRGIVRVIVANDKQMRQLNMNFMGRSRTTDVLAFPMENPHPFPWGDDLTGEIYCNYDHAVRWSRENGGTITTELARLAVHGCLHLLGYDHHSEGEQRRMAATENRYLADTGLIASRVRVRGR